MPDGSHNFLEGITILVSAGIGSLLMALGISKSQVSKAECKAKQEGCIKSVESRLDSIASDVTEIKEFQQKLFKDFYKPRIDGD